MPWFIYKFPEDPLEEMSYTLVRGTPRCTGNTLSAIFADVQPNTDPALPVIKRKTKVAIEKALIGEITPGITMLRMGQ